MRWSLHLDLPRKRVASPAGAETHVFEKVKRHGIGARHEEPNAIEYEFFAAKVEHAQQEPSAETEATIALMKEDRQLRFSSSLGRTKHGVTYNAVAYLGDELVEALLAELRQPPPNVGFSARRQPLVLALRLKLQVHGDEPPIVVAYHFSERGLHGFVYSTANTMGTRHPEKVLTP
jgi:hypothetical protein